MHIYIYTYIQIQINKYMYIYIYLSIYYTYTSLYIYSNTNNGLGFLGAPFFWHFGTFLREKRSRQLSPKPAGNLQHIHDTYINLNFKALVGSPKPRVTCLGKRIAGRREVHIVRLVLHNPFGHLYRLGY